MLDIIKYEIYNTYVKKFMSEISKIDGIEIMNKQRSGSYYIIKVYNKYNFNNWQKVKKIYLKYKI